MLDSYASWDRRDPATRGCRRCSAALWRAPRAAGLIAPMLLLLGAVCARAEEADPRGASGPMPAEEAARQMKLPEGFHATVFAAEPDVVQPIAFTFDQRGRMWVAECMSYPIWKETGRDRIVIFEDVDGDGRFDTKKQFWDRGNYITGMEVGHGGVWVVSAPDLIFIPDADGDDVPDGEPQVLLDGWSHQGVHNLVSTLVWGPDGWLYGCNGCSSPSQVGPPGTPRERRIHVDGGVWRFHPTRRAFEVVAVGTCNPWGLDFNDFGEAFFTTCVVEHLWHVVPGIRFRRKGGSDFNPYSYALVGPCCDHIHWGGGPWQESRGGQAVHDKAGGGHAHAGAMIYLGDNWPDRYRGQIFMNNLHGRRVNCDALRRQGSAYVASHENDFLSVTDPWFRGLGIKYGPDGAAYLSDWNDTGECHDRDPIHRETGRIYKISYGEPGQSPSAVRPFDLSKKSDTELVQLHLHRNDWFVRQARRLLAERRAGGAQLSAATGQLREILDTNKDVTRKLRAMWTLHALDAWDEGQLLAALESDYEYVRVWAVRLLCDAAAPSPAVAARFAQMAARDLSARVRLELASALQRIDTADRWTLATALVSRQEDAGDAVLPLMIWYGVEPLVALDAGRAARSLAGGNMPLVRRHVARRIASLAASPPPGGDGAAQFEGLMRLLTRSGDTDLQHDILLGIAQGIEGRPKVALPALWPELFPVLSKSPRNEVRELAVELALRFGDPVALAQLRETMMHSDVADAQRLSALRALAKNNTRGLAGDLQQLVRRGQLRETAITALAGFADPETPGVLLEHYEKFSRSERQAAIWTLASRRDYARALLDAVQQRTIPAQDLTPAVARQISQLKDPKIDQRLGALWGHAKELSKKDRRRIDEYRKMLQPAALQAASVGGGRRLYERTCGQCHKLYEEGGTLGPDLTGTQRHNLDYLLENILAPSAIVLKQFQMTVVTTKDGRVLTGMLGVQDDQTLQLLTPQESLILARQDIEDVETTNLSTMPDGLLDKLSDEEVRDLFAFVMRKRP